MYRMGLAYTETVHPFAQSLKAAISPPLNTDSGYTSIIWTTKMIGAKTNMAVNTTS